METSTVTENRESLFAVLAAGARRATDGQLVLAVVAGLTGGTAILLWALSWWRWTLPLVGVAAFGGWGIFDRVARERATSQGPGFGGYRVLFAARWLTALLGGCALVAAGLVFMAQALGLMKS
jgi:hypothetical protein